MNEPTAPSDSCTRPPVDKARGRIVAGGVLLAIALVALAAPHFPWARNGSAVLLLLGVAFVVWAALGRVSGLLVPGGILLGLGAGNALRPQFGNLGFLLCLAGGFLLISVLNLALFGRAGRKHWWTIWPALGLTITAVSAESGPELREMFRNAWPYALLVAALVLIASGLRAKKS